MRLPFLHPLKKVTHSISVWPRRKYTWTLIWKKSLFVMKAARVFPFPTGRVERGWWTLLQCLTLSPHERDSLEDKYMLAPSKKGLPSPFSLARKRIYFALIWKNSWLICFKSYNGIPYFHRQSRMSMVNTLLMVSTTPICKR